MKVLIAGDYCPRERVADLLEKEAYKDVFSDIEPYIKGADYSIVNFECPVVKSEAMPISKCGPALKCSPKAVNALNWAGFKGVTLANNHFYDYGEAGVNDTLDELQRQGIDSVGGGRNAKEAAKVLYKEINGETLAIVNCCEHEFSIATDNTGGSNPLNIVQQYYAIQEAKRRADYVLVIIHGGVELFWHPSKRMLETYRFFIDVGADAVVNHHQHCYSGYEEYRGKPIFYGLGNFCFDGIGSGERWTSGVMAEIDFSDNIIDYQLYPYRQCDERPKIKLMKDSELEEFKERISQYNAVIADDAKREREYQKWCEQTESMFKTALNPCYNRYSRAFFESRIGRRILNKRKLLRTLDVIANESHVERLRLMVERMINDAK